MEEHHMHSHAFIVNRCILLLLLLMEAASVCPVCANPHTACTCEGCTSARLDTKISIIIFNYYYYYYYKATCMHLHYIKLNAQCRLC